MVTAFVVLAADVVGRILVYISVVVGTILVLIVSVAGACVTKETNVS